MDEDDCVQTYLNQVKLLDPTAYIRSDDIGTSQTQVICVVTTDMLRTYETSPEVLFIDGTYKVSNESQFIA